MLELIGDAEVLFQHWVDKLRSGGSALIDATALIAAAQRIESGAEEVPETAAEAPLEADVELPNIVIGGVSLSPVLFKIATDEAASIIETLQRLVAALREDDQSIISYDFVRAAHTLTGVNRSTGFTDISDVAGALESWLQDRMNSMAPPDILQLNLLEQTISALGEMINSLRSKQEPKPRTDLITRLQIKKKELAIPSNEGIKMDGLQPLEIGTNDASEQIQALSYGETEPVDEDIDLVAYVQRATQEHASEPLQWQSAEETSSLSADNDGQIAAQQHCVRSKSGNRHATNTEISDLPLRSRQGCEAVHAGSTSRAAGH